MKTFRGQIFETLKEWETAEALAHKTCNKSKKYTSPKYSTPIETTKGEFILIEVKGFKTQLKKAGFKFEDLDKTIIKTVEEI